jgi:putative methyltransferase (TIGR04325 family)
LENKMDTEWVKRIARWVERVVPPRMISAAQKALGRPRFYGDFDSFTSAQQASTGYNSSAIAQAAADRLRATLATVEPPPVNARTSQVLAALRSIHSHHHSVLDVGGASGMYYYELRPHLPHLTWTVLETPEMVRAHQGLGSLRYVSDPEMAGSDYDVVLMSGVLQYLPDPYAALQDFCRRGDWLLVDRLPLIERDRITVQSTGPHSYPAWFFSREKFMRMLPRRPQLEWAVPQDRPWLDGRRVRFCGMLVQASSQ